MPRRKSGKETKAEPTQPQAEVERQTDGWWFEYDVFAADPRGEYIIGTFRSKLIAMPKEEVKRRAEEMTKTLPFSYSRVVKHVIISHAMNLNET